MIAGFIVVMEPSNYRKKDSTWKLELHKRIFILDMGWTNMRALKGDSPEILKRPFFWKVED